MSGQNYNQTEISYKHTKRIGLNVIAVDTITIITNREFGLKLYKRKGVDTVIKIVILDDKIISEISDTFEYNNIDSIDKFIVMMLSEDPVLRYFNTYSNSRTEREDYYIYYKRKKLKPNSMSAISHYIHGVMYALEGNYHSSSGNYIIYELSVISIYIDNKRKSKNIFLLF